MEAEEREWILGFQDALAGKDCKASSMEYVQGFKRGKEIARKFKTRR